MNRDEILKKSRVENAKGDERQKYINLKAYETGIFWILIIIVALMIISFIIFIATGKEFINMQVLSLFLFLSLAGESFTKYQFKKNTHNLIIFALAAIAVVAILCAITAKFLGL